MPTYVIGDIHGRFGVLEALIDAIRFDPSRDELWFVGDLVNNGHENVEVVRWVRALGDRARVVLGNHDLHALAVHYGASEPRKKDTLDDILGAQDAGELFDWMRHRPMFVERGEWAMVHAGLLPQWTIAQARACARELERALRASDPSAFFERMYGNEPAIWSDELGDVERLRITVNAMTRARVCTPEGHLDFAYKGTLETVPEGLVPWFRAPSARDGAVKVCFGHWSALGLHEEGAYVGLDSGCTWGRALSALRLDDGAVVQVDASFELHPDPPLRR